MHRRHQLQLVVQLDAVVAGQRGAERPQGTLAHDAVDGGGAAAQHGDGALCLLKPVLQLVLRGHSVEEGLRAQRDLPRDAHLHHVQVVTQLGGDTTQLVNMSTCKKCAFTCCTHK